MLDDASKHDECRRSEESTQQHYWPSGRRQREVTSHGVDDSGCNSLWPTTTSREDCSADDRTVPKISTDCTDVTTLRLICGKKVCRDGAPGFHVCGRSDGLREQTENVVDRCSTDDFDDDSDDDGGDTQLKVQGYDQLLQQLPASARNVSSFSSSFQCIS